MPTSSCTFTDRIDSLNLPQRALLLMLTGLLTGLCFIPYTLWPILPLCLALYLRLLHGQSYKWMFRFGLLFGLAWSATDLFWFKNIFGAAAISLWFIVSLFPALAGTLFHFVVSRLRLSPVLAIAVTWTGIEFYRSELFPLSFGWLGLGYAYVNDHALMRVAAFAGSYGITFLCAACSGAIYMTLSGSKPQLAATALFLLTALNLTPCHGAYSGAPLHVRLVQAPSEDDEHQFALSAATGSQTPEILIWPEYSFLTNPLDQPITHAKLAKLLAQTNSILVFGGERRLDTSTPNGFENTAFVLDKQGNLIGTHVKNHTVHFFRDGRAGHDSNAIVTPGGKIGVAICFDMDYPDVARRLTNDGAEVLLVPNNDPESWGEVQRMQHNLMFRMRAVECGRWLARADVAGGTSITSPDGVVTAHVKGSGPELLDGDIYRLNDRNVFVRGGWRFGSVCFFAVVVMVLGSALVTLRSRRLQAQ